jgi:hypothetical protein
MNFVDINPNYEYLVKNISFFHFQAMFRKNSKTHKDGWLEETNLPTSESVFENWKKNQIDLFLKEAKDLEVSDIRLKSLEDLVNELKQYGNVFLIRMPIGKEFLAYEYEYYPDFDVIIDTLAKINHIPYIDFNKFEKTYKTYDGHHLNKFSGKGFTEDLCDLINNNLNKSN